jgi:hypothetical protein
MALGLAVGAGILLAVVSSPAVAQALAFQQALEVLAPSNAATNPHGVLTAVACTSAGNCVGAGQYDVTATDQEAMAAVEKAGDWSLATEVRSPSDVAANPKASVGGISCTSAGNCAAGGSFTDGSGHVQAMVASEASGSWAQATEVTAPSNAAANPGAQILGVDCTSAGNCVAVGEYVDTHSATQAFTATETAGTWASAVQVTPPSNAATNGVAILDGISCTSAGNCVAVGTYLNSSGFGEAMAVLESSGTWGQGSVVAAPTSARLNPNSVLDAVSCAAADDCTAVGSYVDSAGDIQAAEATETSGTWGRQAEVKAPAGAASNPDVSLLGVSCTSPGNCTAVGSYLAGSLVVPTEATESAGTWAGAVSVTTPANASATSGAQLAGVSCAWAGDCTAVGNYGDTSSHGQAMAATEVSPPAVAKLSPASGYTTGGTLVTITGSDFTGATAVHFGSALAKIDRIVSPTEIQATAPPEASGKVAVTVTTPAGTSAKTSVDEFAYSLEEGYWLAVRSGGVYAAGSAASLGGMPSSVATSSNPVVGIASTPDAHGYVVATANGTVQPFGTARFYGDLPSDHIHPNRPVVAVAETADGGGYWLLSSDGGFFAFGDAKFRGSVPGLGDTVSDVVTMEADPVGIGYWMAGADGTVWHFGSAGFCGDLPSLHVHPNRPIVAMLPSSTGKGYVLVASDGGAFKFGSGVHFYGSLPGIGVKVTDVIGLALTPDDGGYFIAAANAGVWGFGDAKAQPTPSGLTSHLPVVAVAGV